MKLKNKFILMKTFLKSMRKFFLISICHELFEDFYIYFSCHLSPPLIKLEDKVDTE